MGTAGVLYAIILHLLAGSVTGTAFKIRTLLLVLGFVVAEFSILTAVQGPRVLGWALASLLAVQVGYVGGMVTRGLLEHAGYASSPADKHRIF